MTSALARRRALPSGSDEQGSMILVVLMIMFITIVMLTATAGAFGALDLSRSSTSRNDTLQAATAGVQAAVADIRSAATTVACPPPIVSCVDPTQLPCTDLSGVTNGTPTPSYSVKIQYYAQNVSGGYDPVACTQGSGPQVTVAGDYLSRAVITSCGPAGACPLSGNPAAAAIWRRVVSTYTFQTTNVHIAGGVISTYPDANQNQECLLAVPLSLSVSVTNSCAAGNPMASLEQFRYLSTWNLAITISNIDYCIQDPEDLSSPLSSPVALVACAGNTANPADQWGINDNAGIQGVATAGGGPNSWCLNNPMGAGGWPAGTVQPATVVSCQNNYSSYYSWQLSASVGAGAATPSGTNLIGSTNQLVNYQQFGRCMDVTDQQVSYQYLINFECKQFPDITHYPTWNQRWCFEPLGTVNANGSQPGLLYTPHNQTTCTGVTDPFCAVSPRILASAVGGSTAWVTVASCLLNSTLSTYQTANEVWTAWGANGGALQDYTWTDQLGSCLEANANNAHDPGGGVPWATIQVDTCSGSYAQKWNAPATLGQSQIANTHEGTGANWTIGP